MYDLDAVLAELKFGKFQIKLFLLIGFPILINAILSSGYIFTAAQIAYRCHIPDCDDEMQSEFLPIWLNRTTPFDSATNLPHTCLKYKRDDEMNSTMDCPVESFTKDVQVCDEGFIFEDPAEITILNNFQLFCDENLFKLSLIGTINNIAQFISFPISGYVSDRYDRRHVLIYGTVFTGVFGILRSFAQNYIQFAACEFLEALFGAATYSSAVILGLEFVAPAKRATMGTFLNFFYALGGAILGLISYFVRDYRVMLRIVYGPALLAISYIYLLPKSVRWLISNGQNAQAKKILLEAAESNGIEFSAEALKSLDSKEISIKDTSDVKQNLTRKIIWRVLNLSYCWFTVTFVYYGLNLNSVYLSSFNKYLNFIFSCLVEIPAYLLTNYLMDKIGRKWTMFVSLVLSGILCVVTELITGDTIKLISFLLGKTAITVTFSCLYMFTIELFPTSLCHRYFAICSTIGRIGSILTPLTPLLIPFWSGLPLILFSALSFSSSFLIFTNLPETLNRKLPSTMEEAFEKT